MQGEDDIVQHYMVKTIENIATQCHATAQQWFLSADLMASLAGHARRSAWEAFRVSSLAAVAHLLRPAGALARGSIEPPLSTGDVSELIGLGLSDLAPRGVPHGMHLLGTFMLSAPQASSGGVA